MQIPFCLTVPFLCWFAIADDASQPATTLRCEVVDADSGDRLPARVYVQLADGRWLFAKSASPDGSAVIYDKQRTESCVEKHTTVSVHLLLVDVPPGRVTVRVERGKEYLPAEQAVEIGREPLNLRIKIALALQWGAARRPGASRPRSGKQSRRWSTASSTPVQ